MSASRTARVCLTSLRCGSGIPCTLCVRPTSAIAAGRLDGGRSAWYTLPCGKALVLVELTRMERPAKHDGRTTDTRAHIVREAERLYYQGGYAGIRLQTVADVLGLTKPALFHHF